MDVCLAGIVEVQKHVDDDNWEARDEAVDQDEAVDWDRETTLLENSRLNMLPARRMSCKL